LSACNCCNFGCWIFTGRQVALDGRSAAANNSQPSMRLPTLPLHILQPTISGNTQSWRWNANQVLFKINFETWILHSQREGCGRLQLWAALSYCIFIFSQDYKENNHWWRSGDGNDGHIAQNHRRYL
jgi:hypothetical protein